MRGSVRNRSRGGRVEAAQLTKRLADDLKLSLDCTAKVVIRFILGKRLSGCEPSDSLRGCARVPKDACASACIQRTTLRGDPVPKVRICEAAWCHKIDRAAEQSF